jgi:peptidyl-dipeptidase A
MTPATTPTSPELRAQAATEIIDRLVTRLEPLQRDHNEAQWRASVTGTAEDAETRAKLDAEIRRMLSDPEPLARVGGLLSAGGVPDSELQRQLVVLRDMLRAHQMPPATIEAMVEIEKRLDTTFNNFRARLDDEPVSDNRLREILQTSNDVGQRRRAWEASKQVGAVVVGPLLELVRLRNAAARDLGYTSYYSMMLELDELDERELFALLDDLDRGTRPLFEHYRRALDARLHQRFGIAPEEVRPWHLADPFFQEAPAADVDLDVHFRDRSVVELTDQFFGAIGFDLRDLLKRADLFEKNGKSQHAFCLSVDRLDDVRVLCNVRPNEFWMGVMLHEFGHAVYDVGIARSLPFLLRTPAHTLTTEASAMLFGRLSKNPWWLTRWAGLPADEAARLGVEIRKATRTQLLVQTRWCLVMSHMERALYRDPSQDLDTLWWDLVERFQLVHRPDGRRAPDWASKIHFSLAPVYYHNYMLGEIMASQLQQSLLRELGDGGTRAWERYVESPDIGRLLTERLYRLGKSVDWRGAIRHATGEELRVDAFIAELSATD